MPLNEEIPLSTRDRISREINEVVLIMNQNVERVLERGENIDALDSRADRLMAGSQQFERFRDLFEFYVESRLFVAKKYYFSQYKSMRPIEQNRTANKTKNVPSKFETMVLCNHCWQCYFRMSNSVHLD